MTLATRPKVGALDAAPVYPIDRPVIDLPTAEELRQMELDSLDTLIDAYADALTQRDDAARRVVVLELRIAVTRAALSGQRMLDHA